MKRNSRLLKAFGKNEFELADLPSTVSGVFISRIIINTDTGCSWCFPHGYETSNSHQTNNQRNWKRKRKQKWKSA